jgi:hypothetical protein
MHHIRTAVGRSSPGEVLPDAMDGNSPAGGVGMAFASDTRSMTRSTPPLPSAGVQGCDKGGLRLRLGRLLGRGTDWVEGRRMGWLESG